MNRNTKLGIAIGLFVVAMGIGAWSMGAFTSAPGATLDAVAVCPKCGSAADMKMSEVFAKGFQDPARGWMVKCSKCGEMAVAGKKENEAAIREKLNSKETE